MSTSVTTADVRTAWPAITSALCGDAVLAAKITQADATAPTSLSADVREYAVRDLAAHLALLYIAAAGSVSGAASGPRRLSSASVVDRSASWEALIVDTSALYSGRAYGSTVPGAQYTSWAAAAARPVVSYPA